MVCSLLRVSVVNRRQNGREFSLKIALEQLQGERWRPEADDLQYLILKMFAEWDDGEGPPLNSSKRVMPLPVLYYLTLLPTGSPDRYIFHQTEGLPF